MSDCSSCSLPCETTSPAPRDAMQTRRRILQAGFFVLFVLAPPLDIFRLDLNLGHFILFGHAWTLGLDGLMAGHGSAAHAALNIILRGFLPLLGIVLLLGWVSWKYGRLYCGWLCPHFSVVEMINGLMRRAMGKFSLWDRSTEGEKRPDGSRVPARPVYWLLVLPAVAGFSFLWAVVLLTYLLTPSEVYGNLLHASLTLRQGLFIGVATLLLSIEFTLARHLFCKFGCAVGVFQSFVWMANRQGMVVSFDRDNASGCRGCYGACEEECPMRLKPRSIKRAMFTCTECARCIDACDQIQAPAGRPGLLEWTRGLQARVESDR